MKRVDLTEIKNLTEGEIFKKVVIAREELVDLSLDKNMGKLKDIKAVVKKRRDIAQMLTILRQKQLLGEVESRVKYLESSEEVKSKKEIVKKMAKKREIKK